MKKYLLLGVVIVTVVIIFSASNYYMRNKIDFFSNIGMKDLSHEGIEELLKSYPSIQEESYTRIYCDGYDLIVEKGKTSYRFIRAEIYDSRYQFGYYEIGVGKKRKQVEDVIKNKKKIKGLSEKEFGYIDDGLWIEFSVNDKDVVEKIKLYYGP